jgi:hypothetical protein
MALRPGRDEGHLGVEVIDLAVSPQPPERNVFHFPLKSEAVCFIDGAAPFGVGLLVV